MSIAKEILNGAVDVIHELGEAKLAESLENCVDDLQRYEYPPIGFIVQVRNDEWPNKAWVHARYEGDEIFKSFTLSLRYDQWRYAPAPWHLAPEEANAWLVWANSSQDWSFNTEVKVGDTYKGNKVVHVEHRPKGVKE